MKAIVRICRSLPRQQRYFSFGKRKTPLFLDKVRPSSQNSDASAAKSAGHEFGKVFIVGFLVSCGVCLGLYYRTKLIFPSDLKQLKADIRYLFESKPEYIPQMIRLIFLQNQSHTQTYKGQTGAAGTSSLRLGNVRHLAKHQEVEELTELLSKIKGFHDGVGMMDIWTLASCLAIEMAGGPEMTSLWKFGRIDSNPYANYPMDRGPSASASGEGGCLQTMAVFARMGLPLEDMVCLMGAHTLGRKHINISGYEGPWTPDEKVFSNSYYKLLLSETWEASDGSGILNRKQKHNDQYVSKTSKVTMLPVDVSLIQNERTLAIVRKYAADEEVWKEDFRHAWTRFCDLNMEWVLYPPAHVDEYPSVLLLMPVALWNLASEFYTRNMVHQMRDIDDRAKGTIDYIKERFSQMAEEGA